MDEEPTNSGYLDIMKTIVVGFSRPTVPTWFARAIMWVDNTPYDHVYIKWNWKGIDRDIIYQASKLAVNFESNLTFNSHALTIEEYEINISDDCHKAIMQFCMDNSNKPYGIKEIFGFAWVKICKKAGYAVHNPFPTHGSSYVCSKLAADILAMTGKIAIGSSPDDIDPLDLNNIVKAAGLKRLV